MARDFPGTAGNAFTAASAPFSIGTWTVAGWAYLDSAPASGCPCMVTHQYSASHLPMVVGIADGTNGTAGRWMTGHYRADIGWYGLSDTVAAPTGVWTHICGTEAGVATQFFRNGVNTNGGSFANAPAGTSFEFRVGRRWDSEGTAAAHLDGRMAHIGIWNVVLSAAEVAALAAGVSPLRIRPSALVAYWPLWGNSSPEPDWAGGDQPLTMVGTVPASTQSPRVGAPLVTAASL